MKRSMRPHLLVRVATAALLVILVTRSRSQVEAGQAEAGQAEPGQAEAGQAEPGQAEPGQAEPGHDLTVYALTFGPGEHPFLKFGHNAILVQPSTGPGWVFNFGTFDFSDPELIPKFLRGRFKYWLSVGGAEPTMEAYAAEDRTILSQELALSAAQKWALWQALRENARPENRAYLYDYFYDNCSTRVRDALDRVTDGRIRAAGQAPATRTLRDHALRSVADFLPEYVGLYLGLSRATDQPIDRWAETFLPEQLADLLRTVRLSDGSGERPLVKSEKVIYQSTRPAKPAQPPHWAIYFLGIGLMVGGALALLGRSGRRHPGARVVLGAATSVLGGLWGLLGLILVCFWAFTNHKVAYANANILQFAPWAIVLVAYGIGVMLGRPGTTRRAGSVALSAMAFSALGIVCKLLPGLNQDNWPFILFSLPVWLGLWVALRAVLRAAE